LEINVAFVPDKYRDAAMASKFHSVELSLQASLQPNCLLHLPRWFFKAFLYACDLVDNRTAVMASQFIKYLLVLVAAVPHSLSASVLQPTPPMGKSIIPYFDLI
jgi:hypothetical protein